jgi:EAL domain-containing protein (putative c-di-GMP-specific phosphodiesterase class I)
LGEILPDEFIPLADRVGVSASLTAFMLSAGLRQAERWWAGGNEWGLAINISMNALLDVELIGIVSRLIKGSTLPANRITLEITETHVMSDAVRTTSVLEDLSALGVRLSIDDFGTGYSSLSYLQRLPVDEVKIDKSFVLALATDRGADAIVRSVLDLARNLDLWVVAEGVEDALAVDRLRALGCGEAQGFYFGEAMPAEELEQFVSRTGGRLTAVPL